MLQLIGRRLLRHPAQMKAAFPQQAVSLRQIAALTSGDDVVPGCPPAPRTRHDVVEGEILGGEMPITVLTEKGIAQEDVEPREGRTTVQAYVFLERDDAGMRNSMVGERTT